MKALLLDEASRLIGQGINVPPGAAFHPEADAADPSSHERRWHALDDRRPDDPPRGSRL
jgi:hypothetical protein